MNYFFHFFRCVIGCSLRNNFDRSARRSGHGQRQTTLHRIAEPPETAGSGRSGGGGGAARLHAAVRAPVNCRFTADHRFTRATAADQRGGTAGNNSDWARGQ